MKVIVIQNKYDIWIFVLPSWFCQVIFESELLNIQLYANERNGPNQKVFVSNCSYSSCGTVGACGTGDQVGNEMVVKNNGERIVK